MNAYSDTTPSDTTPSDTTPSDTTPSDTTPSDTTLKKRSKLSTPSKSQPRHYNGAAQSGKGNGKRRHTTGQPSIGTNNTSIQPEASPLPPTDTAKTSNGLSIDDRRLARIVAPGSLFDLLLRSSRELPEHVSPVYNELSRYVLEIYETVYSQEKCEVLFALTYAEYSKAKKALIQALIAGGTHPSDPAIVRAFKICSDRSNYRTYLNAAHGKLQDILQVEYDSSFSAMVRKAVRDENRWTLRRFIDGAVFHILTLAFVIALGGLLYQYSESYMPYLKWMADKMANSLHIKDVGDFFQGK